MYKPRSLERLEGESEEDYRLRLLKGVFGDLLNRDINDTSCAATQADLDVIINDVEFPEEVRQRAQEMKNRYYGQ
ncbi:hypothetical protein SAMN04488128_103754 [Chitinophaga eiseniae]|uniref:Uncharacterized protein n=1 Tax=Chitinophaga eiseniae TaxID=634771 RepID=A0A1T4SYN9_9BACT|nr:hypothetical protein SAMN04488128_103754 [Chitinophaga eiseniae]